MKKFLLSSIFAYSLIFSFSYSQSTLPTDPDALAAIKLAETYRHTSVRKDSAAYWYEQAEEILEGQEQWEEASRQYFHAINMYWLSRDFDRMLDRMHRNQTLIENHLPDTHELAGDSHALFAQHYAMISDLPNMRLYAKKAKDILLNLPTPYAHHRYVSLGSILTEIEEDEEAIPLLKTILQIADTLQPFNEADQYRFTANDCLGRIYYRKGNFFESIKVNLRIREWAIKRNFKGLIQVSNMVLGLNYEGLGDYERALDSYRSSLVSRLQYSNLSTIFDKLNMTDSAEYYLEKALSTPPIEGYRNENPEYQGYLYMNAGNFYYDQQKPMLGKKYLKQAEEWMLSNEFPYLQIDIYNSFGNQLFKQKQYSAAAKYLYQAIETTEGMGSDQGALLTYSCSLLGQVQAAQGKWSQAIETYHRGINALALTHIPKGSLPAPTEALSPVDYLNILRHLIELRLKRGSEAENDLTKALEACQLSMDLVGLIHQNIRRSSSEEAWAENAVDICESGLEICHRLSLTSDDPSIIQQALKFSEQSKSILLNKALNQNYAMNFAGLPDSLINKEQITKINVGHYWQKVSELQKNPESDSAALVYNQQKLTLFQEAYDQLEEYLEQEFPNYYQLRYDYQVASLEGIQANLPPKTGMIEYFVGEHTIYVIGISSTAFFFQKLDTALIHRQQLKEVLDALHSQVADPMPEHFQQHLAQLYQWLLAPTLAKLGPLDHLILIPDGFLAYLPFEILQREPGENQTHYLLERYSISYANSATLLYLKKNQRSPTLPFAGFGPSYQKELQLPYTQQEVVELQSLMKGEAFVNEQASEEHFRQVGTKANILHLAMHGFPNPEDPLQSHLLFQLDPDKSEDGKLFAYELYNMNLSANLTVLSACHTGYGPIAKGEGIRSLARAFQYAGCPSVLMSLWEANGVVAKDLMPLFYQHLKDGLPKDVALQRAKLAYLADAPAHLRDPRFWANFVLVGDADSLAEKQGAWWGWWILLAVVALGLGLWGMKYLSRTHRS